MSKKSNKSKRKREMLKKAQKEFRHKMKQTDLLSQSNISRSIFDKKKGWSNENMGPLADMHVHLDIPDSYNLLEDVIKEAKLFNVHTLGITDHNYTGTKFGVGKYLKEHNIPDNQIFVNYDDEMKIIPGFEVNTRYKGLKFHLTAFGTNRDPRLPINKLIKLEYDREYIRHNLFYILLKEFGSKITFDQYQSIQRLAHKEIDSMVYMDGAILLDYLKKINTSSCSNIDSSEIKLAYKVITSTQGANPYKMNNVNIYSTFHLQTPDIIRLIHDAGGIAIWAHPPLLTTIPGNYGRAYNELLEIGLDGVEAYGEEFMFNNIFRTNDPAKKDSLIISGGADRHIPNRYYGHARGIITKPIFENDLPILKKLNEMNSLPKSEIKIKSISDALIENGTPDPIDYEKLMNSLKISFAKYIVSQKIDLYVEHFNINESILNRIISNPKNNQFFLNYFNYLCSDKVGKPNVSPMNNLAELINKKMNNKNIEPSNVQNPDPETVISEEYVKKCEESFDTNIW